MATSGIKRSKGGTYAKVGTFPKNYKHIRPGDPCTFKSTKHHNGWPKDKEVYGKIMQVHIAEKDSFILVAADSSFHSFGGTLFKIYPKGHVDFDFYLKIRDANLGTLLRQRAMKERKDAFQGDLILPFGK